MAHGESRGKSGSCNDFLSPGRGDIITTAEGDSYVAPIRSGLTLYSALRDPTAFAVGHIIARLTQLPRSKANFRRFREVRFVFSTSASRKLKIVTNTL